MSSPHLESTETTTSAAPRVFVVTPCLDQARYLRQTIDSVLAQEYPRLDYFVADGGSTDGCVEILRSYGDRVRWTSGPDEGQAAAIADAWAASDADILAWLNSDDLYLPGAVERAVRELAARPAAGLVYGQAWYVDESGERLRAYPTRPFDAERLRNDCFVCQPAAFVRRAALERVGLPDRTLRYCMDYDLWIRLARVAEVAYVEEFLACSRLHAETKSHRELTAMFAEIVGVTARRYGVASRNWAVAEMIHRTKMRIGPLGRLLPKRLAQRLQAALVQRLERRYRGPVFSDLWAGTTTLVTVVPDAAGRAEIPVESPYWPHAEPLALVVEHEGRELARRTLAERGEFRLELDVPGATPGAPVQLTVRANRTFVPCVSGFAPWDERPLSFLVR
jgi:glycosyltransferase involved in cell wall biosynthesis